MSKKHIGASVRDGGIIIKRQDYNGDYELRVISEDGEEHRFLIDEEHLRKLQVETTEPYGRSETEESFIDRLKYLITGDR